MSNDSGRKSLRLQGYDYTRPGYYHIIIATRQGHRCFGSVIAANIHLSTLGQIAQESLLSLPDRFPNIELDHYVVMPDHIHALIAIKDPTANPNAHIDQMPTRFQSYWRILESEKLSPGAVPLYEVMRTLKAVTSYHAHRKGRAPSFAWHSGYYERIIGEHERSLYNVRRYITNNPLKWELQRQQWEAEGFRWIRIPHQATIH